MRFLPSHTRVHALAKELKLETVNFCSQKSDNFLHVRGRQFRESEVKEIEFCLIKY